MAEKKPNSMIQPQQEIGSSSSVSADLDTGPSAKLKGVMIQPEQNVRRSSTMRTDLDTTLLETNLSPKVEDIMTQPEQNAGSSSSARTDMKTTLLNRSQECPRALLQLDPSFARRDAGIGESSLGDAIRVAERASLKKVIIPDAVMSMYLNELDSSPSEAFSLSDRLGKMIDTHLQLLMEVSPRYNRTFLHIAVAANSERQVRTVLDHITGRALINGNHASKVVQYLSTEEKVCGYTAYQIACVVGNKDIKDMIKNCLISSRKSIGMLSSSSDPVEARDEESKKVEVEHPKVQLKRTLQSKKRSEQIGTIGEVLKSHLEPLGFSKTPLHNMSLGDEFRLHTSLIVGDSGQSIGCWMKYHNAENNDGVERLHKYHKAKKNGAVGNLLHNIVAELKEKGLLTTFLELRDKAGRTILHYLADFRCPKAGDSLQDRLRDDIFELLMTFLPRDSVDINVRDHVGRTPLHLAAAQGLDKRVVYFAGRFKKINLNATYDMPSFGVNRDGNPEMIVEKISPLILAVLMDKSIVVESLLNIARERSLDITLRIGKEIRRIGQSRQVWWTPLQLAAYLGHIKTLEVLLEDDRVIDSNQIPSSLDLNADSLSSLPVLHLAVLGSHPHVVRALLKCKKIEPSSRDFQKGNTALHYALLHYIYEDVYGPWTDVSISRSIDPVYTLRKTTKCQSSSAVMGCIDLLLHAGLDPDLSDVHNQIRHQTIPEDVHKWWYDKVPRELQEEKNNINAATNAISVTAALVATTSFMGPLQPPLGLSNNSDPENLWLFGYTQVDHPAVQIFLFFDSLSFYFAIASIMLALIPSLPVQEETLLLGVKRSQGFLQGAVVLLFASIAFLLCTFSAGSIVIIPQGKWKHQALTIFTTIFGGLICFVALVFFLKRLWRLTRSPKRQSLR